MLLDEPLIFERGSPRAAGLAASPASTARPCRRCPPELRREDDSPGFPEVERARGAAPLRAPLAVELQRRDDALPARLVHDEVQPGRQRGARRGCRASPACIRWCPTRWRRARSSCSRELEARARCGERARRGLAAARGRRARRARSACCSCAPTTCDRGDARQRVSHPVERARHESGERRALRLRGDRGPGGRARAPRRRRPWLRRWTSRSPRSWSPTRTRSASSRRRSRPSRRRCTRAAASSTWTAPT